MPSIGRIIKWSAIEQFSVQGIRFILTLCIARCVMPSDYGLIAMLAIFMELSTLLVDSGFSVALIQKQQRTEDDCCTVFYFNIICSLFLYGLLFACAPLIASFYHEPRLTLLTRILALNIILSSLGSIHSTLLTIQLDFKRAAKASIPGTIISGITALILAYLGFGVWALVIQSLLCSLLSTLFLWRLTKWLPTRKFSPTSFRELGNFSTKVLLTYIIDKIYINMYALVIGRFYTPTLVGYYNRAASTANCASFNLVMLLNRVYYPLLCEKQDDDQQFTETFHNYVTFASYIIVPLCLGLAAVAEPFIEVILSHKWAGAIWPLKILLWAYALYPLMSINCQPLNARKRSDLLLIAEIIKKLLAVLFMIIAIHYNIIVLCCSILLYNVIDILIIIPFVKKVADTGYVRQFKLLSPIFFSGILMELIIELFFGAVSMPYWLQLVTGIPLGVIIYIALSYLLKIKEFKLCLGYLKKHE